MRQSNPVMKRHTLYVPVIFFICLLIAACSKDHPDKRNVYLGTYKLTGAGKIVIEGQGPIHEYAITDTAFMTIDRGDSADYIALRGVAIAGDADASFKFVDNGERVDQTYWRGTTKYATITSN